MNSNIFEKIYCKRLHQECCWTRLTSCWSWVKLCVKVAKVHVQSTIIKAFIAPSRPIRRAKTHPSHTIGSLPHNPEKKCNQTQWVWTPVRVLCVWAGCSVCVQGALCVSRAFKDASGGHKRHIRIVVILALLMPYLCCLDIWGLS